MKQFFLSLTVLLTATLCATAAPEPDYKGLTEKNHPRLFLDAAAFKQIRKDVAKGTNPNLTIIHEQMMQQADKGKEGKPLVYQKDASGRRILTISRRALQRIPAQAYAYRMTGDKAYLEQVEDDLLTVCAFPDWNPKHFLDVAEMVTAVSIGYDWLYRDLSPRTRETVWEKISEFAFAPAKEKKYTKWLGGINNWNQVCNGGLVCAALATWERDPETARFLVERAIPSNRHAMEEMYAPDGAYPEGPGYWGYGTSYQVLLISALESVLGTDFGLSEVPGFSRTGHYIAHTAGPSGYQFNYSDCGRRAGAHPCLWYFAARFNDPGIVRNELWHIQNGRYRGDRTLFLAVRYAAQIKDKELPAPKENIYAAQGITPQFIGRTGWEREDLFVAVKGGSAYTNHAHMDAGEFVYDAYGIRWAMDYGNPPYSYLEVWLKPYNESLFSRKQEGRRWQFFPYNNRQHNTLTVNDKDHKINGRALLVEHFNDAERGIGAVIDFGDTFYDDLRSAVRTVRICEKSYLEVSDAIATKPGVPARVRWSMVTEARPERTPEGILLTKGKIKMLLHTEGQAVDYRIWEANMDTYGPAAEIVDPVCKGTWIVGYETEIPGGSSVSLSTTLRRRK